MAQVNRVEFLQRLEALQPGLAPREIVQQSSCFIFQKGTVLTYNDEVACHSESGLPKKLTGAVQAKPLVDLLYKMPEEIVEVEAADDVLLVKGKGRRSGIRMEPEVTMPLDKLETVEEWKKLHEDFAEGVTIASACAGKDADKFAFTCVHITPKWLEACDNVQMVRYRLKTGIATRALVRKDSIKPIVSLDMTEFGETESWLHFRNPAGLIYSVRRYAEEYKDIGPYLDVHGAKLVLPKRLDKAVQAAEVFSADDKDNNQVLVELRPGKMKVKGVGTYGWYSEVKKLPGYKGATLSFLVRPQLLVEITKRHTECEVSSEYLRVDGGRFVYVACLSQAEADKPAVKEKE
jgi:hypothetical protein